jgi:4-hydroxy-4-methyl-2-oxoglutarate aldolase
LGRRGRTSLTVAEDPWREHVRRLRRLDACAVSDALDQLKFTGVVSGLPRLSGGGRIAGRAVPFQVGPGAPPPGPPRHLGTWAIEAAGPDYIIVVEQRSGVVAGCWGGLLTLAAKMKGVEGVVADGPVRDIDEAEAYEFPIFARSLTAQTARGRVVELSAGVRATLGETVVSAGDYVLADNSAVIIIAADRIEPVLQAAERIVAREAAMAKALLAGTPSSQVMGGAYEHMLTESE